MQSYTRSTEDIYIASIMAKEKLIIDLDTGIDDAQALMMALRASRDHELIAVTCVAGNVGVEQVCINTLRVLKTCNRLEVPVYRGCSSALVAEEFDASVHHGADGMGNAPDPNPPSASLVQPENACQALVRLANKYTGEITLVALAPLTNIATALKLDPEFGSKLKKTVIMGGNIEGKGNTIRCAEFNFHFDPEAAFIVLRDLRCPMQIISWECCLGNGFDWDLMDKLFEFETPVAKFHAEITVHAIKRKKEVNKYSHYFSCDPSAMAVALVPKTVMTSTKAYCTVELQGSLTRGQMVVDWNGKLGKAPNVEVVQTLDKGIVMALYEEMLK